MHINAAAKYPAYIERCQKIRKSVSADDRVYAGWQKNGRLSADGRSDMLFFGWRTRLYIYTAGLAGGRAGVYTGGWTSERSAACGDRARTCLAGEWRAGAGSVTRRTHEMAHADACPDYSVDWSYSRHSDDALIRHTRRNGAAARICVYLHVSVKHNFIHNRPHTALPDNFP